MELPSLIGRILAATCLAIATANAMAQTIKIGLIHSSSGPWASLGDLVDKSVKLYMKQNADKLPPGVKMGIEAFLAAQSARFKRPRALFIRPESCAAAC